MEGAYATVRLFPLSPQGAKARRAMNTRRESGCSECSNRWDESSVLVRYVLLISFPVIFSFLSLILCYFCFLESFIPILLACFLHLPHVSVYICQFLIFFPFLADSNFMSTFYLSFNTLSFVLDMLPKIPSTFCFHYTLESKK